MTQPATAAADLSHERAAYAQAFFACLKPLRHIACHSRADNADEPSYLTARRNQRSHPAVFAQAIT
jgi:hypothetical protein